MNAWRYFWERLFRGVHGKRLFAVDAEAYRALRLAAAQQQRSPQEFAASLFTQAAREQSRNAQVMQLWAQLTPRQQQVCAYVCRGDSTRQIAACLSISPTTVKTHVEAALSKYGVNNRAALRELLAPWDLSEYL
jgi:DNA-binding CsgD family transcriptional regulator